jgi:hypothetical protein
MPTAFDHDQWSTFVGDAAMADGPIHIPGTLVTGNRFARSRSLRRGAIVVRAKAIWYAIVCAKGVIDGRSIA